MRSSRNHSGTLKRQAATTRLHSTVQRRGPPKVDIRDNRPHFRGHERTKGGMSRLSFARAFVGLRMVEKKERTEKHSVIATTALPPTRRKIQ